MVQMVPWSLFTSHYSQLNKLCFGVVFEFIDVFFDE